jgi:uncharacterized protein
MKFSHFPLRFFALLLAALSVFPALAADAPKKILVVTVTMGFRHSSIPTSEKILAQMAKESGKFTVDFVRQPEGMPRPPQAPRSGKEKGDVDGAKAKYEAELKAYEATWPAKAAEALQKLSPANLKNYDAVMFVSTTGDLPLPNPQAFVDWVAAGKAFIGVHAAADTFHQTGSFKGFPPYVAMLGGAFQTHGPQVTVECINQDSKHAACAHLPARWTVFDEIYQFKDFTRSQVHGLITLEKLQVNSDASKQVPGDWPIAWARNHGKGRVFYTSLGHREDVWDPSHDGGKEGRKNSAEVAKQFQQHLLGGILWALGLAPGSAGPPTKLFCV